MAAVEDIRERFADMSIKYGLIVVQPKDRSDFFLDSKVLRHNACTILWDDYVNGEVDLLFVRRIDDPGTPLYTMTVENNTVNTFRGACNSIPDNRAIAFVHEWANVNGIDCAFINRKGA